MHPAPSVPVPTAGAPARTTSRLRRLGAATALVGAPALFLVQGLTGPPGSEDLGAELRQIAADSGGAQTAVLAAFVGTVLLVPAFLALVGLARGRAGALADWAGGLTVVGAVAFAALWGVDIVQLGLVAPASATHPR